MTRDFGRASSPVFTFGIAPKTTPVSAGKELVERYCHTKGRNIALAFLIVPLQTSGTDVIIITCLGINGVLANAVQTSM